MLLSWFFWVTLPPQTPAHNPKKLPRDIGTNLAKFVVGYHFPCDHYGLVLEKFEKQTILELNCTILDRTEHTVFERTGKTLIFSNVRLGF